MTTEKVFQQFIQEIDQIKTTIQLKLPAPAKSVRQQITRITAAQERLKAIDEEIYLFANRGIRPSARRQYLNLRALVRSMILDGNDFKLLAEEYFYDPEGTVMLLHDLNQRDVELQTRIRQLKTTGLNQTQIIFALWRVRPGGSRAYQQAVQELKRLSS